MSVSDLLLEITYEVGVTFNPLESSVTEKAS